MMCMALALLTLALGPLTSLAEEGATGGAAGEQAAFEQTEQPAPEQTPEAEEQAGPVGETAGPDLRFSRDFSSQYAEAGNVVTLSYILRNNSAQPVENIVVTDSLVGEVGRIEKLASGERKTLTARVRVSQSCLSEPQVTFEYGGESHTQTRPGERIHLARVNLKVELSADKLNVAPGETVTLRLKLVNEGNVTLYGLRAEDPVLGELGSLVKTLSPGGECAATRTVQMKNAGAFQFSVTGSSDTGGALSVKSNEISVRVTPVAAEIRLELKAKANRTQLQGPGPVVFSLYVNNDCALELRNVTLSEERMGEVRQLVFVPTGEMPAITQEYEVRESGSYRFLARITDSVGDELTVYSEPIEITVGEAEETEAPSPSPGVTNIPVMEGASYRMDENPALLERVMLGGALILVVLLLIWYALARARRTRAKRKARRARNARKKKGARKREK